MQVRTKGAHKAALGSNKAANDDKADKAEAKNEKNEAEDDADKA